MPANSSNSQPSPFKPPIVVVPADDKRLDFSIPPNKNFEAFYEDDAQKLMRTKLMAIWNTTTIKFEFNGTGIAVAGLTRKSFPLIPKNLLPSFSCTVDGQPADPPDPGTSDIPADGKNTILCRKTDLRADQHHILSVQVTVSSIPAFIDSIRYRPLPDDVSGKITLNDTFLRIDSQDTEYIRFDKQGWKYTQSGLLTSIKSDRPPPERSMKITIPSNQMQQLKWFGDLVSVDHGHDQHRRSNFPSSKSLSVVLDEVPIEVPTSHNGWDESKELFNLRLNNSMISSPSHVLSISPPEGYQLSLDHLLVTLGDPMVQNLAGSDSTKMRGHSVSPVIPIISGIVGSLFIISMTLFTVKWIQKRRRHAWKDSALPSAIQHPATSVSSGSSFSREVVTGDIEYNPEAQKKLEGALNAEIMDPPQALVLHADSGYRVRNASEVPPRYTRM